MKGNINENKSKNTTKTVTKYDLDYIRALIITALVIFGALSGVSAQTKEENYSPSERPITAPKIKQYLKDDQYFDRALHGVSKPYPSSLMFLKDQGAWYTPFTHPGMLDRYDIRGWHASEQTNNANPISRSISTEPTK